MFKLYKVLKDISTKLQNVLHKSDVVNNLASTAIDKPLSANQGKVLKGQIDGIENNIVSIKSIVGNTLTGNGVSNVYLIISDATEIIDVFISGSGVSNDYGNHLPVVGSFSFNATTKRLDMYVWKENDSFTNPRYTVIYKKIKEQ